MAKENSFDIVSQVDLQEVDNAYQQTLKELSTRYDLKDSNAKVEFSKADKAFTVHAPADFVAKQVIDVLNTKLIRRNVDIKALKWSDPIAATGQSVRLVGTVQEGIEQDVAKKISKDIRDSGQKVKASIEGDKLRVSSASRDALQAIIAMLKENDYGLPLQYINYR
ncbi:MAG: YajQ family cyclic di-GMP-binding protein [Coriobacteriia bacterium]|nr:YajQ family cyclic di-GMP-binding protein [Coriobacteriia bacterium]